MEEEKDKKGAIRKGIKALRRHLKPFKKEMIILSFLGVLSAIGNGSIPYITGRFFDSLIFVAQNQSISDGKLPLWGVLLVVWALIQLIVNNVDWVMDRLRRTVDTKLHLTIQEQGFLHFFHLPLSFHKQTHINGALQKMSMAGWRVSAIVQNIISITPQFLSVFIGIALAISINGMLAGVLALGVFVYLIVLIKMLLPIAAIDEQAHRVWSEEWDRAAAAVHQIESVKNASSEEYESEKTRASFSGRLFTLWYTLERHWSNVSFFQRMIVFLTQLSIFVLSVGFVAKGIISVGELVALNGYSLMFFGPFVQLGHSWQTIQNGLISAAHAEEIFKEKEEAYEPEGGVNLPKIDGSVVFEGVDFKYAPDQPEVLSNINFEVKPGEVVAFVGASGVGKTTSIGLISAYYFPTKGNVKVNGVDTHTVNLKSLREIIATVPQEVALFNDTIAMNIGYGSFNASEKDIESVSKEAYLEEFILSLPQGYKTVVGERGVKLSVGQKQRVAIARAMLRKPKILILDEPTSALDAKTEKQITESLEKLMKGRTTFIIAHRLSTVRRADTIFVFEKGSIVERGRHDELIQIENGIYRNLYEHQIGLHA